MIKACEIFHKLADLCVTKCYIAYVLAYQRVHIGQQKEKYKKMETREINEWGNGEQVGAGVRN